MSSNKFHLSAGSNDAKMFDKINWKCRFSLFIRHLHFDCRCLSFAEDERKRNHIRQREGIDAAMARGVEFGRPKLKKPDNYEAVMQRVASGEIKGVQAMKILGVKKTSYYKLKKMYPIERQV